MIFSNPGKMQRLISKHCLMMLMQTLNEMNIELKLLS